MHQIPTKEGKKPLTFQVFSSYGDTSLRELLVQLEGSMLGALWVLDTALLRTSPTCPHMCLLL